ncbi:MAG: aldo/keto reductase, partial [Acetobacteraceae bacterium]
RRVVHKALDCGITFFDTADVYGGRGASESCLGRILGERRKDIVLATKFAKPMDDGGALKGASRRYIFQAAEASLKRLATDWIDLYQLHEPDPLTPIEETLSALDDLVRAGKVRYIGCSNLPAWQVAEAHCTARALGVAGFICCQDEYSLVARGIEAELIPAIAHFGLGLVPYYPLAAGFLSGKYRRNAPLPAGARVTKMEELRVKFLAEANWQRLEKLAGFAALRGHSLLELAHSWLLARPAVASVITGATTPEQVGENVAAGGWRLNAEDLAEIDRPGG